MALKWHISVAGVAWLGGNLRVGCVAQPPGCDSNQGQLLECNHNALNSNHGPLSAGAAAVCCLLKVAIVFNLHSAELRCLMQPRGGANSGERKCRR